VRRLIVLTQLRHLAWRCLLAAALVVIVSGVTARGDTGWLIRGYDVALAIESDATVSVTETIDAEFSRPKHGIVRDIPIRYSVGMHQYSLRFRLLGVDDGGGRPIETEVTHLENRVRIRIGDADRTITGPARFRIRYEIERAILWEGNMAWGISDPDHAVLRWNATGTEWDVPIRRIKVTARLPRDLDDSELVSDAWTGAYGLKGKDFAKRRIDGHTLEFEAANFRAGEGISVELTMPADAVSQPGRWRELSWWLEDNFVYALFPGTLAVCIAAWYLRGRDPAGSGTIVVNYQPPEGLSPAEVGTLIDERVDLKDISASIIDLAVRGYLTIQEVPSDGWLSRKSDYRFTRLKATDGLKTFEKQLCDNLFDRRETVLLSAIETKFYPVIQQVQRHLYGGLSKARYFDGNPSTVRTSFLGLGLVAVAVAAGIFALVQNLLIGRVFMAPLLIAAVPSAVVVALTSRVMPRKTQRGREAWEKIAGLEEYIRRAEVEDIEAQDRRGIFERLLPYAIVFGLSDRWAKAFAGLYTQPPNWYQPIDANNYTTWRLMNDIDRSIWMMNQSLPSVPRSSGSAGGATGQGYQWSSGGFSGGGSSGGGFGGGGGSSW
jgi:uncharacterized membrane protein YgcG